MTDNPPASTTAQVPPASLHILLALSAGEKHGYAIMQEVAEISDGKVRMGPGTLYGSIKRMVESGWIEETDEPPDPDDDDERRRYYRLTDVGEATLAAEMSRLAKLVKEAEKRNVVSLRSLAKPKTSG